MLGWLAMALGAFIYLKIIYKIKGPKFKYRIEKVNLAGEIIEVVMRALGKPMNFEGGQFIFVSFKEAAVGAEKHPFSIAGGDGKKIKLAIKKSGDYTKRLDQLKANTEATLWGPYGKLGRNFGDLSGVVLIAAGIGVTPMLGMIDREEKKPQDRPIDLIYSVRSEKEAYGLAQLKKMKNKNFRLQVWESETKGRIEAKDIVKMTEDYKHKRYIICGPTLMMAQIKQGLVEAGVGAERIEYEDFELK
jgi:predicted ferric reductase